MRPTTNVLEIRLTRESPYGTANEGFIGTIVN
jgi:hypothetical protein